MPNFLCVSVSFLDARFHGRRDGGAPEWPPSPLRLFQALVASSAARWPAAAFADYAAPALRWLESLSAPVIATPEQRTGQPYRLSVPNNAMDIVGRAWSRGNTSNSGDANPATHKAMKTVRPTHLVGGESVAYLWELPEPLTEEVRGYAEVISAAARGIVAVGWGIDMVAADGRLLDASAAGAVAGERWRPAVGTTDGGLRVPRPGTVAALARRHQAFLNRMTELAPVPALTEYEVVGYRRATDPATRQFAAFQLLKPDASGFRPFDSVRRTAVVAGMVRHLAAEMAAAAGWSESKVNTFVHGHTADGNDRGTGGPRFLYVPLPSIERRGPKGERRPEHVSSVRRVLVVAPPGGATEIGWARRTLSGQELIDEQTKQPAAVLSLIPTTDPHIQSYVGVASVWSTVTPVILPGYDDHDAAKAEALLRKAIGQAGFPPELAAAAVLDWRQVGFRAGVEKAIRYEPPTHLKAFPRYHVRIRWPNAVRGPVVIGGGRHCGFGTFAVES
ncbi:MAG: type I-U CRISPR-associated protein Csb2 [Gemmataceae bacterium]